METLKLCESDYKFMTVIWDNEPVPSGKLVVLCAEALGWKKPTTYTTLRNSATEALLRMWIPSLLLWFLGSRPRHLPAIIL